MDLGKLERFLTLMKNGVPKRQSHHEIRDSLDEHLWKHIFTLYRVVYSVPTAASMRRLIRMRRIPSQSSYNPRYLRKMFREGLLPHGSLRMHTYIEVLDRVLFFIPVAYTTAMKITSLGRVHVFNYGPIHERRKSILKSTVVFAWPDVMKRVLKTYTNTARGA
ncbi:MAG: hypothetical protein ACTSYF_08745 [Promethearchaeota archaeon]